MSESKLSKYLQKTVVNVPAGSRLRTPVILSDSKGFSLRNQITHPFDNNIVWWCKKGAKIEESLAWLKRNIDRNLQNLGDIALYVWLGTCNLTSKDKSRFIYVQSYISGIRKAMLMTLWHETIWIHNVWIPICFQTWKTPIPMFVCICGFFIFLYAQQ